MPPLWHRGSDVIVRHPFRKVSVLVITLRLWQLVCNPPRLNSSLCHCSKTCNVYASGHHFEKDVHFLRLVRREPDVDLITAALEIARDAQPQLNFEPLCRNFGSPLLD